MEWINNILVLVCLGIGFIGIGLFLILVKINRKKAITAVIIAAVFLAVTLYYAYLSFYNGAAGCFKTTGQTAVEQQSLRQPPLPAAAAAPEPTLSPATGEQAVFEVDGQKTVVDADDYLVVGKTSVINVLGARDNGLPQKGVKVHVVGFVHKNMADRNDAGYPLTYAKLLKKFAIDAKKDVFKVELRQNKTLLATVYLKFTP